MFNYLSLLTFFICLCLCFSEKYSHEKPDKNINYQSCSPPSLNLVVCDQTIQSINCPENKLIYINSAYLGRTSSKACLLSDIFIQTGISGTRNDLTNTNCQSETSTYFMQTLCNGQNQCIYSSAMAVNIAGSLDWNSCSKTNLYMNISYSCIDPLFVCNGISYKPSCPSGQVMSVLSSFYGRKDTTTCPALNSHEDVITTCNYCDSATSSTYSLQESCNGKQSCYFTASSGALAIANPCKGVSKYLQINFVCTAPITICLTNTNADGITGPVTDFYLLCQPNQEIIIHSAYLGASECSNPMLQSTDCKAGFSISLYNYCKGKYACNIKPSNIVTVLKNSGFGFTCPLTTYKYLQVIYTCALPV